MLNIKLKPQPPLQLSFYFLSTAYKVALEYRGTFRRIECFIRVCHLSLIIAQNLQRYA